MTFDGTTKVPDNVQIIVIDKATNTNEQEVSPNKTNGSYIIIVHPGKSGKTFTVNYQADGFQAKSFTIEVPANTSYDEIEKELVLIFQMYLEISQEKWI